MASGTVGPGRDRNEWSPPVPSRSASFHPVLHPCFSPPTADGGTFIAWHSGLSRRLHRFTRRLSRRPAPLRGCGRRLGRARRARTHHRDRRRNRRGTAPRQQPAGQRSCGRADRPGVRGRRALRDRRPRGAGPDRLRTAGGSGGHAARTVVPCRVRRRGARDARRDRTGPDLRSGVRTRRRDGSRLHGAEDRRAARPPARRGGIRSGRRVGGGDRRRTDALAEVAAGGARGARAAGGGGAPGRGHRGVRSAGAAGWR